MMKKMVLMGGAFLFASVALCAEGKAVSYDDSSEVCVKKNGKEALEGFYAGLGICYLRTAGDATFIGSNALPRIDPVEVSNAKSGKIGGSLAFGWGSFVTGNFYTGAEFLVDISGNKTSNSDLNILGGSVQTQIKSRGVIPSLALRFGGYCNSLNTLFFAKIGAARVSSEYKDVSKAIPWFKSDNFIATGVAPVVGLGAETKVGSVGLRVDYDYRFRTDKKGTVQEGSGYVYTAEHRFKGQSIGFLVTYHF